MIVSKSGYLSVRKCLFDTLGGGGISGFQEKKSAVYMGTCFLFFCYMQINKEANIVLINDSEDAKEDGK